MSSRTATLTPTPRGKIPRNGSRLIPNSSAALSTPLRAGTAETREKSTTSAIASQPGASGASGAAEESTNGTGSQGFDVLEGEEGMENGLEEEKDLEMPISIAGSISPILADSASTHGPLKSSAETIIIDSDSDQSNLTNSTLTNLPRRIRRRIPSVKGTPYVDIPVVSLAHLRNWELWDGCRYPSALSRRDQLNYSQTPQCSPGASSAAGPSRQQRSGKFPRWAVMKNTESSDDLGGYGEVDSEKDDDLVSPSDNSDGNVVVRRTARGKGKGKEVETRRSTRSGAAIPRSSRQSKNVDLTSSRSTSTSRDSAVPAVLKRGRRARRKGKAQEMDVSSDEDYESEEDELEDESEGSKYDVKPRLKGKGGKMGRKASALEITDDVLYHHRNFCEKCRRGPADLILAQAREEKRKSKAKKQKRKRDEDAMSDEEVALELEGWLTCERCVVSCHWGCLAAGQKKDVLIELQAKEGPVEHGRRKIRGVEIHEEATFTCSKCSVSLGCLVCHKDKPPDEGDGPKDASPTAGGHSITNGHDKRADVDGDGDMPEANASPYKKENQDEDEEQESYLRFRCFRCKQEAHYEHLPNPYEEDVFLAEIAYYYQHPTEKGGDSWECHQCRTWIWNVDIIIGWRPLPAGAKEDLAADEAVNYKDNLPREYLVKWTNRGFRHVTWVPHPWLLAAAALKLRYFLEKGPALNLITDGTLAARGDDMADPTISNVMEEAEAANGHQSSQHKGEKDKNAWLAAGPAPDVDAESSVPVAWSTIDRILDVMLILPVIKPKGKGKAKTNDAHCLAIHGDANQTMDDGIEPPYDQRVGIDDWEEQAGVQLGEGDVDHIAKMVTWCYVKWDDLQYDQSTWDTPPPLDSTLYPAYKAALGRYLRDRNVKIPILNGKECDKREDKAAKWTRPPKTQPECIVGGTLMPFQMNGFQWLLTKYFKRESCILADDMGLGKTIQIASLLGFLGSDEHKIYPFLVVVPNSTITNWAREFQKWVPHMRSVPYYGTNTSRKIISKYELYRQGLQGKAEGLKAHVVLTTYDVITGSDFNVFSKVPRWEMLVVDEGQRLKSDSNLIFSRLKTLNAVHRILLTGTPLNNNLRELFNLLNFLDPVNFKGLNDLEEKFFHLNENLLAELHAMIQPYILRRIKADVLRLPPKIEIIVPISLTPMQKKIYRGILERHTDLLQAVLHQKKKRAPKAKPVIEGGGAIEPVRTEFIEGVVNEPGFSFEAILQGKEGVSTSRQDGGEVLEDGSDPTQEDQSDCVTLEDTI